MKSYHKLSQMLSVLGAEIEISRKQSSVIIEDEEDLLKNVPEGAGVYWIETNMPLDKILIAIKNVSGKEKKTRISTPEGVGFCSHGVDGFQVVYVGTRTDIRGRLFEHLFNKGNENTGKLRCKIDDEAFLGHAWRVSYCLIDDHSVRYAIESWWRLNVGWPIFCIR